MPHQPILPPIPEPQFGPVVIGPREIYDAIVRVSAKQDQTNGRLDVMSAQLTDVITKQDDHEERIRSLERGRWPLPALGILLSAASLVLVLWSINR